MDMEKLKQAAKLIIEAVGENPEREGLADTPERFARMMAERLEYCSISNEEIARRFNKTFECSDKDLVFLKDIEVFSFCEHHIALMYDMKVAVGYIPCGRVIGISKIARIADAVTKRLQIQERIGEDIRAVLQMILDTPDIIVCIEGEHSCMTARGIRSVGTKTVTVSSGGLFRDFDRQQMFMGMIK